MTTRPPPKRDPPIEAEEIGEDFESVDEMELEDITGDLSPEEIAALESGQPSEVISMTRSIIPSIPGVDPDIDLSLDKLFEKAILAEEKTEPRIVTSKPPPPVAEEEDEDDAFYAQFERKA